MGVNTNEMPDSTKELLTVHHAAILRELDATSTMVRGDIQALRADVAQTNSRMDAHDHRLGGIERGLSVLQWAYGIGSVIVAAVAAKLGWKA